MVQQGMVSGWDDPRMPTLCGARRRGYTPEAIRAFCDRIGVSKREGLVDITLLEHSVREDLNARAPRAMAVLRPLKVVLENYPEGQVEWLDAANHPSDPSMGMRKVPFGRELWLEREDFMEDPPKKFFRLAPGREVRLRYGYFIKCTGVVKDPATGEITELRCTYDPETRGGNAPDGRKVKVTLHWVAAAQSVPAEVRLYERMFTKEDPMDAEEGQDWMAYLSKTSMEVLTARVEPSLAEAKPEDKFQFERLGYFCADRRDHAPGKLVFNRTVGLHDPLANLGKQGKLDG
jgi:glutaminyl-tRNA synthetase